MGSLHTILAAGLVVAVLDGADAAVFIGIIRGVTIIKVFQFIASGLLGEKAFQQGWMSAALGALIHTVIAVGIAAAFYLLSAWMPIMLEKPWLSGSLFGISVFLFMHFIVVRLSRTPPRSLRLPDFLNLLFAHIFFVGLPIAIIVSRSQHFSRYLSH